MRRVGPSPGQHQPSVCASVTSLCVQQYLPPHSHFFVLRHRCCSRTCRSLHATRERRPLPRLRPRVGTGIDDLSTAEFQPLCSPPCRHSLGIMCAVPMQSTPMCMWPTGNLESLLTPTDQRTGFLPCIHFHQIVCGFTASSWKPALSPPPA